MTIANESLKSNKKQEVSEEDDNMMTRILISFGSVIFILIVVIIIFIVCRKRNKKNQNNVNASDEDDKKLRSNRVSDISANVGLMDLEVENEDFENSAALNIKHSRRISVNKEDGEGDGTPPTHVNSVD